MTALWSNITQVQIQRQAHNSCIFSAITKPFKTSATSSENGDKHSTYLLWLRWLSKEARHELMVLVLFWFPIISNFFLRFWKISPRWEVYKLRYYLLSLTAHDLSLVRGCWSLELWIGSEWHRSKNNRIHCSSNCDSDNGVWYIFYYCSNKA